MLSRSLGTHKRTASIGLAMALTATLMGGATLAQDESVTILSTQFEPVNEREQMRNVILADVPVPTDYQVVASTGEFFTEIETRPEGDIDALGALHGEFATLAQQGQLMDLSDLAEEFSDVVSPALMEVGRLGTDTQYYIPWMQATYIMAANVDALEHLPEGADINALTWDQWRDWGANLMEATGERRLGLPLLGGPGNGLPHRLLQGYLYPSFTGAVNNEFATEKGLAMWDWLKDAFQYVNPASSTYSFMQVPLQNREVDVAWDHTSRLIDVLRAEPDQFVAFPAPAGPEGRGFMPVIVGLGILEGTDDPEGAKELIRHYLRPETQGLVLETVGFFPVLAGEVPANIDEGLQKELDAVAAQAASEDALPSLLPIGLGERGADYNFDFQDVLVWIAVLDGDPENLLRNQFGPAIQGHLTTAGAECWPPDEVVAGEVCQVGGLPTEE